MSTIDPDATPKPGPRLAPVRMGILGAARIARLFVEGVTPSETVSVTAVASRDRLRANVFARETGVAIVHDTYEELLADPEVEAVYNPLPNSFHAPWSIRACEAGKHVLCEKPLALSAAEAQSTRPSRTECYCLRPILIFASRRPQPAPARRQGRGWPAAVDPGGLRLSTAAGR